MATCFGVLERDLESSVTLNLVPGLQLSGLLEGLSMLKGKNWEMAAGLPERSD